MTIAGHEGARAAIRVQILGLVDGNHGHFHYRSVRDLCELLRTKRATTHDALIDVIRSGAVTRSGKTLTRPEKEGKAMDTQAQVDTRTQRRFRQGDVVAAMRLLINHGKQDRTTKEYIFHEGWHDKRVFDMLSDMHPSWQIFLAWRRKEFGYLAGEHANRAQSNAQDKRHMTERLEKLEERLNALEHAVYGKPAREAD